MFGLGKKKVGQAEFEAKLIRLADLYKEWGGVPGGVTPELVSALVEFKRMTPPTKGNDRLRKVLCDMLENQIKAMSCLSRASEKASFAESAREYRIGQVYLARMNQAAATLVEHVEALDDSDPVRKLLIAHGVYDPTGAN
jgi:hypothetical protein